MNEKILVQEDIILKKIINFSYYEMLKTNNLIQIVSFSKQRLSLKNQKDLHLS